MKNSLNRNSCRLKIKQNAVGRKRKVVTVFDSAEPFDAAGQSPGESIDFADDGFGDVNPEIRQIIVGRLSDTNAVLIALGPVELVSSAFLG